MKKYQKETKSSRQKKKAPRNIQKETIDIAQLVHRTSNKKRSNSSHPLKSSFSKKRRFTDQEMNRLSKRSFGSQVVPINKLKQSLIRTGLKNNDFYSQNQEENTFGIEDYKSEN
jgi:hypothetical protein